MSSPENTTRRSFLALTAAASLAPAVAKKKARPVGLELYSVRNELRQDLMGTVRAVAKMGYEGVEFYSPYFDWTNDYAKQVKSLLDDTGIRCFSTHNGVKSFTSDGLSRAIELNQIIGSKFIIMASAGQVKDLDGWKKVAETLTTASEKLKPVGLRTGFHNHLAEFLPVEGKRPMEVLAANTPKNVVLQMDIGTVVEAKSDPIAWINANPGRIVSMHCKDWAPADGPDKQDKGFRTLVGEGVVPWKKVLPLAEKKGGLEYYLVEQEGSRYSPMETAERCLAAFKKLQNA